MMLDAQHCYEALKARDTRFDGTFFVGVSTTGIYCRPVCTARLPRAERCNYYPNAAAAEQAGYRPCMRCRPELAPGFSPVDSVRTAARWVAARIREGALNAKSLEDLAAEYGLSSRQLRRVIEQEYGVSPVELAQTHRLLLAKQLLTDSNLAMADVAFASGFSSVRRFNHLFSSRYGLNPLRVRQKGKIENNADAFVLKLGYRPPLAWAHLIGFLASRGASGVESVSGNRYRCTVRIGQHQGWVAAAPLEQHHQIRVEIAPTLLPVLPQLLMQLRRLFDLDANPQIIEAQLSKSKQLRRLVQGLRGLRVPGTLDSFALAARAILGQQVSVKAATALYNRYVKAFGEPIATPWPELTHLTPAVQRITQTPLQDLVNLGVPGKRAQSLLTMAQALNSGALRLEPACDVAASAAALVKLPGIGDWTASYIAMRALRDPDAFPQTDLGLCKALQADKSKDILAMAETWRPWRAYAALHLWNSLNAGG
jgi:AraC family transcriptional regulator of adaptative response / DNA-3-methyladenine glycosylase II